MCCKLHVTWAAILIVNLPTYVELTFCISDWLTAFVLQFLLKK